MVLGFASSGMNFIGVGTNGVILFVHGLTSSIIVGLGTLRDGPSSLWTYDLAVCVLSWVYLILMVVELIYIANSSEVSGPADWSPLYKFIRYAGMITMIVLGGMRYRDIENDDSIHLGYSDTCNDIAVYWLCIVSLWLLV